MLKFFLILFLLIVPGPLLLILEKRYAKTHAQQIDHKKRNMVLAVLRGILLLFLIAAGFLIYKTEYEPKEIGVYDRKPYSLAIYHVGEPGFPFGTSDCRLTLSRDGRRISTMDVTLHNDGKNPDTENFIVEWREDRVCVTVRGEEQEDTLCTLYFDGEGMRPLDAPQEFRANLIRWEKDGLRVQICDPMDNTVFPDGAELTVRFTEGTYFIDLDGSVTEYHPHRSLFERTVGKKLGWVEGMVLQIGFSACADYSEGNGFGNRALGGRIENVDVIVVYEG
jgi:hypothetical protein